MELLDIYDKNRIFTGKTIVRGERLAAEEYVTVALVWIVNSGENCLSPCAVLKRSIVLTSGKTQAERYSRESAA